VTPVRSVPVVARPALLTEREFACEPTHPEGTRSATALTSPALPPAPARRLEAEPLTSTVTRIHVSVSPAFLEKLEDARLALSHSLPGASDEDVLSAGLDLLLERDAKRKGLVERPKPAPPEVRATPGATYIPAAVKREVWRRDGGAASGRSTPAACAAPGSDSSSTTSSCGWTAGGRSRRTSGCSVEPITSSQRASGWGTGS
jgi:hypothetical protein